MPPGIYRLPLELVREVVGALPRSRDIAALAATSRHFHAWVNPGLYEHNIKHDGADAAIWAAVHGRLDTLLLLDRAEPQSPSPFINKIWRGNALSKEFSFIQQLRYGPAMVMVMLNLLHLAAEGGHDHVSTSLCKCAYRNDIGAWTPLHHAICNSKGETVKLLLANNASFQTNPENRIEALHIAAAMGLTSMIRHLSTLPGFNPNVKDLRGETPLHYGIKESRSLDVIKALLDLGADIQGAYDDGSPNPDTPLWRAIQEYELEMVVMLLQAGAQPFPRKDTETKRVAPYRQQLRRHRHDHPHQPTLLQATLKGASITNDNERRGVLQRKVIRALLDFGCDVNEKYGHKTPLILAVKKSSPATVRLLLEKGANTDRKSGCYFALFYALSLGHGWGSIIGKVEKIMALLEHGANLLDGNVISKLIVEGSTSGVKNAVADNLGPENLKSSHDMPLARALVVCLLFKERRIYDQVKKYGQAQARATDVDIIYALDQAAHSDRPVVPSSGADLRPLLHEIRPGLTVDDVLRLLRDKNAPDLVKWLEKM